MDQYTPEQIAEMQAKAAEAEKLKEQIGKFQTQLDETHKKLEAAQKSGGDVAAIQKQLDEQKRAMDERDLTLAKKEALVSFDNLKSFEGASDMIRGSTPQEIMESAKKLSESIAKRDEAQKTAFAEQNKHLWGQVPHSSASSIAQTKDRKDEYAAVRADKTLPKNLKVTKLMQMKLSDNAKSVVNYMQRALGISAPAQKV